MPMMLDSETRPREYRSKILWREAPVLVQFHSVSQLQSQHLVQHAVHNLRREAGAAS